MNSFKHLEAKLIAVASLVGEASELLTMLEADESWSEEFRLNNPEIASGIDGALDTATSMTTDLDGFIGHLKRLLEYMSQTLESFQTSRGEIGKPSKNNPGLN